MRSGAEISPHFEVFGIPREGAVGRRTNDFYLTANNNSRNKKVLAGLWDDVVQVPEYLRADDPLGGFLWIGPAGRSRPFTTT